MPSLCMARAVFPLLCRLALTFFAAALTGCQFTATPERSSAPLGDPRSGEVFLVRGLLGIFSTGMDDLQSQLAKQGVRCVALQHSESASAARWIIDHHTPSSGPVILVGHSLGADETIAIADKLQRAHIPVRLLITLDPVNAGPVPTNVQQAINYYRPGAFDVLPMLRGIPLKAAGSAATLQNLDLNNHPELREPGTNHFSIDNNSRIQHTILTQILSVCPPERDPAGGRAIRASMTLTPERP